MPKCLILGYGNSLRSDDGFGWKAAVAAAKQAPSDDVNVIAVHQLTPELAEAVALSSRVLFLDVSPYGEPGQIRIRQLQRDPNAFALASSHQLSPPALLELVYRHFGAEPHATLLTTTGKNFEFGDRLSQEVENALDDCLEKILRWIRDAQLRPAHGAHDAARK